MTYRDNFKQQQQIDNLIWEVDDHFEKVEKIKETQGFESLT